MTPRECLSSTNAGFTDFLQTKDQIFPEVEQRYSLLSAHSNSDVMD